MNHYKEEYNKLDRVINTYENITKLINETDEN